MGKSKSTLEAEARLKKVKAEMDAKRARLGQNEYGDYVDKDGNLETKGVKGQLNRDSVKRGRAAKQHEKFLRLKTIIASDDIDGNYEVLNNIELTNEEKIEYKNSPYFEQSMFGEVEYLIDNRVVRQVYFRAPKSEAKYWIGMSLPDPEEPFNWGFGEQVRLHELGKRSTGVVAEIQGDGSDKGRTFYAINNSGSRKFVNVMPLIGMAELIKDNDEYTIQGIKVGAFSGLVLFPKIGDKLKEDKIGVEKYKNLASLLSPIWGIGHPIQLGRALIHLHAHINKLELPEKDPYFNEMKFYPPNGTYTTYEIKDDKVVINRKLAGNSQKYNEFDIEYIYNLFKYIYSEYYYILEPIPGIHSNWHTYAKFMHYVQMPYRAIKRVLGLR